MICDIRKTYLSVGITSQYVVGYCLLDNYVPKEDITVNFTGIVYNRINVLSSHHTLFNYIFENSFLRNKHITQYRTLNKAQCTCYGSSPPQEISRVDGNKMVQKTTRTSTPSPRRGFALPMKRGSRGGSTNTRFEEQVDDRAIAELSLECLQHASRSPGRQTAPPQVIANRTPPTCTFPCMKQFSSPSPKPPPWLLTCRKSHSRPRVYPPSSAIFLLKKKRATRRWSNKRQVLLLRLIMELLRLEQSPPSGIRLVCIYWMLKQRPPSSGYRIVLWLRPISCANYICVFQYSFPYSTCCLWQRMLRYFLGIRRHSKPIIR